MPTRNLLVVSNPSNWQIPLDSVDIISAREYLSPDSPQRGTDARVFNLCRSYAYQSLGYYVSLLAEARGQRAIPSVSTLRDFGSTGIARSFGEEMDEHIQTALRQQTGNEFALAVYFGQTIDPALSKLGTRLYRFFPAPLLKVQFARRAQHWSLERVAPLQLNQVPEEEREQVHQFAAKYFTRRHQPRPPRQRFLYDLAILVDPQEKSPPSDERALQKFSSAARELGFFVERISRQDADRLPEFDALFIRETTAVNHHTYRLARLAHAEGLVVIDDPWSILRSANKIYLAESLLRARIDTPRTTILTKDDLAAAKLERVPLPCVLKVPDGAFSLGVKKVETPEALADSLREMLRRSELIIAQEFVPSEYDWRIGILDHQPLFACKYYMAKGHWQIYNWEANTPRGVVGKSETLLVDLVPPAIVEAALKAARLIGDGFYGVDLKQIGSRVMVIEVNDNPNMESGIEDAQLGMELYRRLARTFRKRIEQARA